jgi:DNA-binding CsgD family transcriptional regulator
LHILGRDRELARLDSALESLTSAAVKVLLEGEPGIGKTTLWREGVRAAAGRSYQVLTSRPSEAESSLSYAGLADMLAAVEPGVFELLPRPQREALDVALLRRAAGERPPDPRAVFTAFVSVLGALARTAPVLVAVDDLQWLDAPTARALEFAGRRTSQLPVGLLIAVRVLDGIVATPRAGWFGADERLRLTPLSAAALQRLIRERLDWSLPRPALLRLHRACSGNAFYSLEIARRLAAEGRLDPREDWPLPDDVRDLVLLRVGALPAAARGALLLAAAAAKPTDDLLDADALAAAASAGLVSVGPGGRVRFSHPLYASALYTDASPAQRRRAHAELAAREPDVAERARHLGLAALEPDDAVAAELDAASAHARARGAPETAAELEERALELTPQADRAGANRRALTAAADWFHAGALARARLLLTALLDAAPDRRLRARALHLLALVHFREESVPEAIELLRESAAAAGDDAGLRAPVELELAYSSVSVSFDFEAARPHADAALACAERLEEPALLAQALAVKTIAEFLLGAGLDEGRLAKALALEDRHGECPVELRPTFVAACLALYIGDLARARSLLQPFCTGLRERGLDSDLPFPLAVTAWLESWAGNLAAACSAGEEAVDLAALGGSETLVGFAHAHAALADAHAGRAARCREHVAAALADIERAGYAVHATWSLSALGLLELSLGDAAAAARAHEPLLAFVERDPPAEPARVFFLPDAIEALVGVGDLERAASLTELFDERARALDRAWALASSGRCRALLLAARGELGGARNVIEEALALHERTSMPLERARCLIAYGQIERRAKRKASARASFEQALAICERIGAKLWAERARAELARLGGGRADDALSATEERIAALAASGLTNREVAAAAFVSQKTVEANLSHVYRKLGIRSRAELGLRLAAQEREPRVPLA